MSRLEKFQTLIVFGAVILGLLLGQVAFIEQSDQFIVPFLFVMLYGVFLNIPLGDFKRAFLNVKFALTVIGINFVWTPILVWGLGAIFLAEHPALWIGFMMLMVTPCTDWYLVFTGIAKGNVPLSTAVLPLNLLLQVILLPVYLFLFAGISGTVDLPALAESVVILLILPFTLAQISKWLFDHVIHLARFKSPYFRFFAGAQTLLLVLVIAAMFASQGRNLLANIEIIYLLLIPILLFYAINFLLAQAVSQAFRYPYADRASLTLTTVAKNSPMTLGIAVMASPMSR